MVIFLQCFGLVWYRFDADPDPTFHFDADPNPDPTPIFTVGKTDFLKFSYSSGSYYCFSFTSAS